MMQSALALLFLAGYLNTQPGSGESQVFTIFEQVDRHSYILGAGDVVQVVVQGGTSELMSLSGLPPQSTCQISGDGVLQFSGVGQVHVAGLTINDAQISLQQLVSLYYPGTTVGLGLLQPRTVKVWINGMVDRPGQYTLYSTSRVSDLVTEAGGMSSYASRTGWMITLQGDSIPIDLHFDRTTGRLASDPFVDGGAVVHFQLVLDPVYVIRPGIRNYTDSYAVPEVETWEWSPEEGISDLIYRIGGVTGNVDLSRSYLISGSERIAVWNRGEGFSSHPVSPGDSLRLVVQGNDVYVAGAVHQRGIIAYSPGAPVSMYVERAGGVLYNGDLKNTTLTRDGVRIAAGREALDIEVLPGDVIEVPYGWVARHAHEIGIVATIVGITSVIVNLTR
jgi:protein involved in polysaccharide export with SLBB domain